MLVAHMSRPRHASRSFLGTLDLLNRLCICKSSFSRLAAHTSTVS